MWVLRSDIGETPGSSAIQLSRKQIICHYDDTIPLSYHHDANLTELH